MQILLRLNRRALDCLVAYALQIVNTHTAGSVRERALYEYTTFF